MLYQWDRDWLESSSLYRKSGVNYTEGSSSRYGPTDAKRHHVATSTPTEILTLQIIFPIRAAKVTSEEFLIPVINDRTINVDSIFAL